MSGRRLVRKGMRVWQWWWLGIFFLLPQYSYAAITFSEIAWMGDGVSPNHEWIELHNDGAATDVTGWVITDGVNLSIELAGAVPAGAYVVLERTSDESAAGTAFLIYTGALVNTGATLRLLRADGSLVDQVSGGKDWETIGGDNVTKDTAQYTSSGWVTAAATPARAITEAEIDDATTEEEEVVIQSSGAVQKSVPAEPVLLTLPDVTLQLRVTAAKTGYVHQPVSFVVTPSGIGDNLLASLAYEWNFGDGTTATAKETTHTYEYPGMYVVTAYAGYKRQEQVARHEITILPVSVSVTMNRDGDVQVNNDSPYELDLSGYKIVADESVMLPPRTILLPNQTITIPEDRVGQTANRMVAVYDAEATLLASAGVTTAADAVPVQQLAAVSSVDYVPEVFPVAPLVAAVEEEILPVSTSEAAAVVPQVAGATYTERVISATASEKKPIDPVSSKWPYVSLAFILLVATVAVYIRPTQQHEYGTEK